MSRSESPMQASDTSTAAAEKQPETPPQKSMSASNRQTERAWFEVKVREGLTLEQILGPLDQLGKG